MGRRRIAWDGGELGSVTATRIVLPVFVGSADVLDREMLT